MINENYTLSWAISLGRLKLARYLIEKGMSVTSINLDAENNLFCCVVDMITKQNEVLTEQQEHQIKDFVQFLIAKGASMECSLNTSRLNLSALSAVEAYYFIPVPLVKWIALTLMENGASVPPRVANDMKLQLKTHLEYLPILKKHHLISQDEEAILLGEVPNEKTAELLDKALKANLYLENQFRQGFLNPELVAMEKIVEIRELKKILKTSSDEQVKRQYERLRLNYQRLSLKHRLLKELKSIREELKQGGDVLSRRVRRINATFSSSLANPIFFPEGKVYWRDIVRKIFRSAIQAEASNLLHEHRILWFHGSRSSSIPLLLRIGSLVPLKTLLNQGLAPPGGEIQSEQDSISGEMFTRHWEEADSLLFGAHTRLHLSILYASKQTGLRSMQFNAEETWLRVTKSDVNRLLESYNPYDQTSWVNLRVDILRLRLSDPKADEKLKGLKAFVEKKLKDPEKKYFERLKKIHNDLNISITQPYTSEDLLYLEDPYPIVFASTTISPEPILNSGSNTEIQEFTHDSRAKLGRDIQYAFTKPGKVEELQRLLEPFDIKVFDFDTAYYLEMVQMTEGSSQMKTLSDFLQTFILPEYATVFPPSPSYQNEKDETILITSPFYGHGIQLYEDYIAKIEAGYILPRELHGPLHATRTALWSYLLGKKEKIEGHALFLLGVGGGAHDWARQDEGKDYWDRASALKLCNRLLALRYPHSDIGPIVHAIAEKDPKFRNFTTLPQKIIHDADVIEIFRCLRSKEDFRKEELALPLEDECIEEMREFIELTESMKRELETTSENLFNSLVSIIQSNDRFKTLRGYL